MNDTTKMTQTTTFRSAFLAEVSRLGGTQTGALDWLDEAARVGVSPKETAEWLAWLCVDDELANLDPEDHRCETLKAALEAATELTTETKYAALNEDTRGYVWRLTDAAVKRHGVDAFAAIVELFVPRADGTSRGGSMSFDEILEAVRRVA